MKGYNIPQRIRLKVAAKLMFFFNNIIYLCTEIYFLMQKSD